MAPTKKKTTKKKTRKSSTSLAKKKQARVNSDMIEMVTIGLRSGYSVDECIIKFQLDRDSIVSIQDDLVEYAKQNAPKQRVLFRQSVRDKMIIAKQFLGDVIAGEHDLEPQKVLSNKLSAAKHLLSFGAKYASEDPMTWFAEQPKLDGEQEKQVGFSIDVDEQGKTNHMVYFLDSLDTDK